MKTVSAIAIALMAISLGCSTTSDSSPVDDINTQGDSHTDADSHKADLHESDTSQLAEAQDESVAGCADGAFFCQNQQLAYCRSGQHEELVDCAEYGWRCEDGTCIAGQKETTTEADYRKRFTELLQHNHLNPVEVDQYGGWVNTPPSLGNPGPGDWFRVQKVDGRWWFVTPDGNLFLSKGVTDVNWLGANLQTDHHHDLLKSIYGDEESWADASRNRMLEWGFNTIGPWSSYSMTTRMPHTSVILDVGGHAPRYPETPAVTDYWSQSFAEHAEKVVVERATPFFEDKRFIGYFLDNELVWEPNWVTDLHLLQLYMDFPPDAPGRSEAVNFLKEQAGDVNQFNQIWGTNLQDLDGIVDLTSQDLAPLSDAALDITIDFAVLAFHKYASIGVDAIRKHDKNHLILGCRFHTFHNNKLITAAADYFDVISLAYYWETPPVPQIDGVWPELDAPFLLEEFSFKAEDSGYWNVMNFAPVVKTQKARALGYADYVETFMKRPYAVAYHWYKWMDNPTKEDNIIAGDNFGLLTPADTPYEDFIRLATPLNQSIYHKH